MKYLSTTTTKYFQFNITKKCNFYGKFHLWLTIIMGEVTKKGAYLNVLFKIIDWADSASKTYCSNDLRFFWIHTSTPNQFHVSVNQSTKCNIREKISSAKYNFYLFICFFSSNILKCVATKVRLFLCAPLVFPFLFLPVWS